MKETKIKTSTLEPRNKSLVRSIIILLAEKRRTQNKRWTGFNDNLDSDDSSHEYPELSRWGRRNESAELHVAWLAEWHNYAELIYGKWRKEKTFSRKTCARPWRPFFGANLSKQSICHVKFKKSYIEFLFSSLHRKRRNGGRGKIERKR